MRLLHLLLLSCLPIVSKSLLATDIGIVGKSIEAMEKLGNYTLRVSAGGCAWFGHAPFCTSVRPFRGTCIYSLNINLDGQVLIKEPKNFVLTDSLRQSYGHGCALSSKKKWCCIWDDIDRSWKGYWISKNTGQLYYCEFLSARNTTVFGPQCGRVKCGSAEQTYEVEISGQKCLQLRFGELQGTAHHGLIYWKNEDGTPNDSWYKVNGQIN